MDVARTILIMVLYLMNPFMISSTPLSGFLHDQCASPAPFGFNTSAYQQNVLDADLTILNNGSSYQTFPAYNVSWGHNPYKVHVLAVCRGDISNDECYSCLKALLPDVSCARVGQTEGITWFAECMVSYANSPITAAFGRSSNVHTWSDRDRMYQYTEPVPYVGLKKLLSELAREAQEAGDKFAAGEGEKVYASVQCSPVLSIADCGDCLANVFTEIVPCCLGTQGYVLLPNCFLMYDSARFYNVTTPPPHGQSTTLHGHSTTLRLSIGVIFAMVSATLVVFLVCICSFGCLLYRRPAERKLDVCPVFSSEDDVDYQAFQFPYETIQSATEDFQQLLGHGGFGPVYKGKLPHGQEIAVKKLSPKSAQGDREFGNEVRLLAKIQHWNLVKLHGFSLKRKERLLVYEYLPNRSLDFYLFDPIKRATLDWEKRYKIIRGIARGIMYLHEDSRLKIIHCDLKVSNILLDDAMNAKISDFGLAKLFEIDQSYKMTDKFAGTYGYAAPEYAIEGVISTKSDVYSFGIMVLEIVTGEQNYKFQKHEESDSLISYVWRKWAENTPLEIIDDVLLANTLMQYEIKRCINLALLCVQEDAEQRPTMTQVIAMLSTCVTELKSPSQPAFTTINSYSAPAEQFLKILQLAELENSEENQIEESDS